MNTNIEFLLKQKETELELIGTELSNLLYEKSYDLDNCADQEKLKRLEKFIVLITKLIEFIKVEQQ